MVVIWETQDGQSVEREEGGEGVGQLEVERFDCFARSFLCRQSVCTYEHWGLRNKVRVRSATSSVWDGQGGRATEGGREGRSELTEEDDLVFVACSPRVLGFCSFEVHTV